VIQCFFSTKDSGLSLFGGSSVFAPCSSCLGAAAGREVWERGFGSSGTKEEFQQSQDGGPDQSLQASTSGKKAMTKLTTKKITPIPPTIQLARLWG